VGAQSIETFGDWLMLTNTHQTLPPSRHNRLLEYKPDGVSDVLGYPLKWISDFHKSDDHMSTIIRPLFGFVLAAGKAMTEGVCSAI
jgi:hypothetical protein